MCFATRISKNVLEMYFYALLKFCSASFVIRHIKYANYHLTFFFMETLLLGNNPVCVCLCVCVMAVLQRSKTTHKKTKTKTGQ